MIVSSGKDVRIPFLEDTLDGVFGVAALIEQTAALSVSHEIVDVGDVSDSLSPKFSVGGENMFNLMNLKM